MKKNLTDLNTSIVEADTHIQEAKAALEETRENLKQWQIDRWERAGDKQDASLSYKRMLMILIISFQPMIMKNV